MSLIPPRGRYARPGLVTRNRDDFITLTVQFFEALKPHKQLVIIPHTIPGFEISKLAASLIELSKDYPQGLEPHTVVFLRLSAQEFGQISRYTI